MPTVVRWNGYCFFFYSNEGLEPKHIHVESGESTAKFWLSLLITYDFSERQLAQIESYIQDNGRCL